MVFAARGQRTRLPSALALFLTRACCGRLVEAHTAINSQKNGRLLDQLWSALPDDRTAREVRANAEAAKTRLNKELGPGMRVPLDLELADFHTGRRGTTFFGVADTVAALAVAELSGADDVLSGVSDMAQAVMSAVGDLQDFADGYLLAFYLVHLGEERLQSAPRAGSAFSDSHGIPTLAEQ